MQDKIILNEKEIDTIELAIIELGGPLHSPFAQHLCRFHYLTYELIMKRIKLGFLDDADEIALIFDVLRVFLAETLETDWETCYEFTKKSDVEKLLQKLQGVYAESYPNQFS